MLQLSDRAWGVAVVGNLFTVRRPVARSEKQYVAGDIPFVASGNVNNGVIKCCSPKPNEELDKGNCITVSPVDGSTFYQSTDFLGRGGAGSSVLLLYNSFMNKHSGLFLARIIRQTCSKYCYGKMGNQEGIKQERIMLPVDEEGNPDYAFMEQYIKEREQQLIQKYKSFIGEITNGGGVIPLDKVEWREFNLTVLFSEIQRGKRLKTEDHIPGEMPYVSSSALNNGVDGFISNVENVRIYSNCLSVANSGSVGSSFYEPFDFVASDHVTHLKNCKLNKYHYLFIATLTGRFSKKYNFNREINDYRISRERIMLPVDEQGNPDYHFMEQYGKRIMLQKYQQYLDYIGA